MRGVALRCNVWSGMFYEGAQTVVLGHGITNQGASCRAMGVCCLYAEQPRRDGTVACMPHGTCTAGGCGCNSMCMHVKGQQRWDQNIPTPESSMRSLCPAFRGSG